MRHEIRSFIGLLACLLWLSIDQTVGVAQRPLETPSSIVGHARASAAPARVVSLWGGARHCIILKSDGTVWDWGYNWFGKLGDGTVDDNRLTPIQVHGASDVGYLASITAIMGGESHNFALQSDGTVWSWGGNSFGQLGDGTLTDRYTPVQVIGLTSVTSLGGRGYHSLAIKSDGTVWTWGLNSFGQLGNGTQVNSSVPVQVVGLSQVLAVTGGYSSSIALMSDHTLRSWGLNASGQLGDGTNTFQTIPVAVKGLSSVSQVSAGWKHVVALKSDGTVWTWGLNANGELGDGTTTNSSVPIQVAGLTNVTAVSGGDCHSAALKSDGTVWTWGCNNTGNGVGNFELGDGTSIERHTPVQVVGLTAVVAIAARDYHNVVLKADGSVWTWGFNANGQLGDNTTIDRSTPVQVIGLGATNTSSVVTVTPSSLKFGATKAGASGVLTAVTPAQTVTVGFSGPTSAWTASSNQPWLTVTGGAGTGGGAFTVAINDPTNLIGASSSLAATITMTSPTSSNVVIPVTLSVDQTGGALTVPAFGQVDTPIQNAGNIVGAIGVTGWVIDDVGVSSVKIYRNCLSFDAPASCQIIQGNSVVFIGDAAFVAGARPDVEAAFSTYPAGNVAGWGYLLLTNMLPHVTNHLGYGGQGAIDLYAFATDLEGHVTLLGRTQTDHTQTSITMDNAHIAKPFGAIDTPAQGGTVSGTFPNFGWVLTPDSNTVADASDIVMPLDGSTMGVFIDGVSIGHPTYNQCRGNVGNPVGASVYCNDDVSNIFGNATPQPTFTARSANATPYRNLDVGRSAIGSFDINTASMTNGIHSIAWGVTDTANRSEGIGSRNFFVLNSGGDAPVTTSGVPPQSRRLSADAVPSRGDVSSLPAMVTTDAPVFGRPGFSALTPWDVVNPAALGARSLQIDQLGRVELQLGGGVSAGYLVVGHALRDLPGGSHLDATSGTFTWAPAPGYLGTYHLMFIAAGGRLPIDVTIRPMTSAAAGESEIRMNVDLPTDGSSTHGAVTIAGWALDPNAFAGAGIDAVHVWAYRRDVPTSSPQFLGAADLSAARPDVANAFGAQFDHAGFGLTTTALALGDYDFVIYAWCERTNRWEDARTVHVVVR